MGEFLRFDMPLCLSSSVVAIVYRALATLTVGLMSERRGRFKAEITTLLVVGLLSCMSMEEAGLNYLLLKKQELRSSDSKWFAVVGLASRRSCRRVFFGEVFFTCENLRVKIRGVLFGMD